MNLKQFRKEIEEIFIFPGSIGDLHKMLGQACNYEPILIPGGKKFLTGIIIPSIGELRELTSMMQEGIGSVQNVLEQVAIGDENPDLTSDLFSKTGEMLEKMTAALYENPAIMKHDIRMKAKELGAHGLVYFQMYTKNDVYMGVPVKAASF